MRELVGFALSASLHFSYVSQSLLWPNPMATDKAASAGIQHGLVGFKPPPVYPESLAEALRQSENGGAFGGPPIPWDIALNLGDYGIV